MDNEAEDYEVGYGKPPKNTQFKKGKSGNPLGRPKKKKNLVDLLQTTLDEEIIVNGVKKSKRELLVMSIVNDAIKGNASSRKLLLPFIDGEEVIEDFTPEMDDKIALMKLNRKLEAQQRKEEE